MNRFWNLFFTAIFATAALLPPVVWSIQNRIPTERELIAIIHAMVLAIGLKVFFEGWDRK